MFFIKEAYFGKSKELLACEAQLHKFRTPYFRKSVLRSMSINSDPELLKFSQMLGDFFGFGILSINVTMTNQINAFTIPIGTRIKNIVTAGRGIKLTTSGYKFKKELDYCCVIGIYSGLILNSKFTDGEVMAILLHEIGHNYFQELSDTNLILNNTCAIFELVFTILIDLFDNPVNIGVDIMNKSDILQSLITKINRYITISFPFLRTIITFFESIIFESTKFIYDTVNGVAYILAPEAMIVEEFIKFGVHLAFSPISYAKYVSEKGADNFASMYGYGPDLFSVTQKLETPKSYQTQKDIYLNLSPLIYYYVESIKCMCALISGQLEEHPTTVARCQDQIDMLEDTLKRGDYDPRLKKRLKEDLETCKSKMVKYKRQIEYQNSTYNIGLSGNPDIWNVAYNRIMETTFGGGLKEIIYKAFGGNKKRFQQYSDKYNKLKNIKFD